MKEAWKKILLLLLILAYVAAVVALYLPDFQQTVHAPTLPRETDDKGGRVSPVPVVASGEWNTYHGDAALTGVASASFPELLRVVWVAPAGAPVEQPPVISGGRIFVVSTRPEVLAFGLDGQPFWRRVLTASEDFTDNAETMYVDAPPAVFAGSVFTGTDTGLVTALRADTGEPFWHAQLDSPINGTVNYDRDTNALLVLEQDTGALVRLDVTTGTVRWRSETVDRADGSPSVGDGIAVYGSCAAALHGISLDTGVKRHELSIEGGGGQVAGGVALVGGYAYAGCRDGRIMCADLGKDAFVWLKPVSELEVFSTPAVKDDWVLVTSLDGMLHALDRTTGEPRWRHELGGEPGSPVIVGDKVVIASEDTLFLVSLQSGKRLWEMRMAGFISDPAVTPNLIVVGCEDGTVIALGPDISKN
ncbi:MAG: Outer membrane protein assembly factor BamB precursor [Candidatus Hydrogenedentes bacterium ADurb.Bin101]|nr:MAG: Outer membrane protein assembly factor BamB precursor [Candidatus Hydrogenedentes bacterium ADurb.Bin101]